MANTPPNLIAGGSIHPSRFVTIDTGHNDTCAVATANAKIIGITMEGTNYPPLSDLSLDGHAADEGDYVKLYGLGDVCLLEAGDVITAGDRLKSDSTGRGVPIATTGTTIQHIGAIALEAAAAAGAMIRVLIVMYSERPALT